MAHVFRLVWDDWNEEHIARHNVTPAEVEEITANRPFITRGRKDRYRLIGQTDSGRLLTVIVAPRGDGETYVLTAREMPRVKNGERINGTKENEMATDAKTKKRSPDFASIEEEAEFWDTHDTTEYEHEFEPVEFEIAKPLKSTWMLSIRLDKETFDALQAIAKPKGLGASTLARMWILEELERVRKHEGEAR